jgi:two-component system sensor histidine kinase QseC
MTSLRTRLFVILVAATGLIWLCAVAWIYLQTKNEVEHVLDTRLQEAARMVSSLVSGSGGVGSNSAQSNSAALPEMASYERQLSCQVWSIDGRLVARSSGAPDEKLSPDSEGFSERTINGETWRVFAVEDATKGTRVMVGDRLGLREHLITDLVLGLLAPTLLIIPLLGLLIWTSLGRGLRPLQAVADELQQRDADDMRAINAAHAPKEIHPVVDAINKLFIKVDTARRHEREVSAFAAHELRTPLAGLKTQAQIALSAADNATKEGALRQILVSVDRTSRLVRQLLAITKLDAGSETEHRDNLIVGQLIGEIADLLKPEGGSISVEIDPKLHHLSLRTNRDILTLAIRNLHENALQHTPEGGTVSWRVTPDGGGIEVQDEGPGIADAELPLVLQRFFRGQHKSASGTGLGLTIVDAAVKQVGGTLTLTNRPDRSGLRAAIIFPSAE